MAAPLPALHDIEDPTPLLPGVPVPWWGWLLLGLVVTAAVTLALLLRRRARDNRPATGQAIYEKYSISLQELRSNLEGRTLASIATDASLAVRGYLAESLAEPVLFETHEEFVLRADALESLPAGARERLAPLLESLAECKYGPSREDPTRGLALVDNCLEVLQGVESTRERPVA